MVDHNNTDCPCILSDVKWLRLGCRSSACGLRHVPALLVFYSYFGSQNAVWCKSQCVKMPPIMSKLKGEKMFSLTRKMLRKTRCRLAPPFQWLAEAQSYSASTVKTFSRAKLIFMGAPNSAAILHNILLKSSWNHGLSHIFSSTWRMQNILLLRNADLRPRIISYVYGVNQDRRMLDKMSIWRCSSWG
jgi:hypothetical protein